MPSPSDEPCEHGCGAPMTTSVITELAVTHEQTDDGPLIQGGPLGHVHMHGVALFRSAPPHRQAHLLGAIADERRRQDEKWGEQNHPDGTRFDYRPLALLADHMPIGVTLEDATALQLAEAAKQATDHLARTAEVTWWDILLEEVCEASAEDDPARLRTELVQVAAVGTQWAEAIDRREATS